MGKSRACPGRCRCGVRCNRPNGHDGFLFVEGGTHVCDKPRPPIKVAPVTEAEYAR